MEQVVQKEVSGVLEKRRKTLRKWMVVYLPVTRDINQTQISSWLNRLGPPEELVLSISSQKYGWMYKQKFQWKKYQFVLKGRNLSYYKMRGNNDKEGELWGSIDIRDVLSLISVDIMGARYPMEVTLKNGKVILLAADCNAERTRWLQALHEQMLSIRKSRRASDTPVVRERSADLNRGIRDWMSKSNPGLDDGSPNFIKDSDDPQDIDSFIDCTFNGITFNRQSQVKKPAPQVSQDSERSGNNT